MGSRGVGVESGEWGWGVGGVGEWGWRVGSGGSRGVGVGSEGFNMCAILSMHYWELVMSGFSTVSTHQETNLLSAISVTLHYLWMPCSLMCSPSSKLT